MLDECSICLENFVLEQSVRIKIEGCNHIFGRNCLTAILTNNPRLEKKCPLCRTVWIAAPARTPSEAPSDLYQSFVNRHSHRLLLSNFLTAEPNSREFAASQGLAPPQVSPFGSRTVGSRTEVTSLPSGPVRVFGRPPNGVINLIDSDDDADVRMPRVSWYCFLTHHVASGELQCHHTRHQQCPRASTQHAGFAKAAQRRQEKGRSSSKFAQDDDSQPRNWQQQRPASRARATHSLPHVYLESHPACSPYPADRRGTYPNELGPTKSQPEWKQEWQPASSPGRRPHRDCRHGCRRRRNSPEQPAEPTSKASSRGVLTSREHPGSSSSWLSTYVRSAVQQPTPEPAIQGPSEPLPPLTNS